MNKQSILSTLAVLGLLGVLGFLLLARRDPGIEVGPYEALGTVAAEETLKLMGDRDRIVVVAQDTRELDMPALTAQLKAFQAAARKKAKVTVDVDLIAMDALTMMTSGGRLPSGYFLETIRRHPKAGAIVLFFGFPLLSSQDLDTLRQRTARLVVVAGYRDEYRMLLEKRLIDLAIVPRFDALPDTARKPRTLREWFEQEYVILAPDPAVALPR